MVYPNTETAVHCQIASNPSLTVNETRQPIPRISTVVFIDSAVEAYHDLIDGITLDAAVFVLDATIDGVFQIAQTLQNYPSVDTIHLVSHGSPGRLSIGNIQLNLETLDDYASYLQSWFTHSDQLIADETAKEQPSAVSFSLLLYGCNVAAGDTGAEFIEKLHHLTGASIAASTTYTGHASLGGNWELDAIAGDINTPLAFSAPVREAYAFVLATFTVTNTNDSGIGSLRQAILDANNAEGEDTIVFDSLLGGGLITLSSGQLIITDDLMIEGLESGNLMISGNDISVNDSNSSTTINVTLEDLEIVGGGIDNAENLIVTNSTVSGNDGSGISNSGTLTVTNSTISKNQNSGISNNFGTVLVTGSTISGNTNTESSGGGIRNYQGNLRVVDSIIANNTAAGDGGGIYSKIDNDLSRYWFDGGSDDFSVTNSIISGNTASNGAAIYSDLNISSDGYHNYNYDYGSFTITDSIIAGNIASNGGAAIYSNSFFHQIVTSSTMIAISRSSILGNTGTGIITEGTTLLVTDSTIAGNAGDGILIVPGGEPGQSPLSIINSTISGNADNGISIIGSDNGRSEWMYLGNSTITGNSVGILADDEGYYVGSSYNDFKFVENTIIAGNLLADVVGEFDSQGYNLIGDGTGSTGFGVGDLVGTSTNPIDPLLSPLQDNGGSTLTHALLPGSLAINAGDPNYGLQFQFLTFDQRGTGFDRINNGRIDIGAFESDLDPLPNAVPIATDDFTRTNENTTLNIAVLDILANDSDADGDILLLSLEGFTANGIAEINDNGTPDDFTDDLIVYTPRANFNGVDQLIYQVRDNKGGFDTATVEITVDPTNNAPTATDDTAITTDGIAININVLNNDSDIDGDVVLLSSVSGSVNGIAQVNDNGTPINTADDFITYTPTAGFTGTDTLTYEVRDDSGATDTATVRITVNPPPSLTLTGTNGNDTLIGGAGHDTIRGGRGNDWIDGGRGNDQLFGEMGNDRFVLRAGDGTDTINRFDNGRDLLVLDGLSFGQLSINASGRGNTTISITSTGEVLAILTRTSATSIGAEDFIPLT